MNGNDMIDIKYDKSKDIYCISIHENFLGLKYEVIISFNYLLQLKYKIDKIVDKRRKVYFTDEDYQNLINPKNLFSSEEEGIEFLKLATCKEDLEAALPHFESAGYYKCCKFIIDQLKMYE
jgi:hypothetical protein